MSKADTVYERLEGMEIEDLVSYAELEQLLGHPAGAQRSALYSAIRRLERDRKRTLACVPNVGYRMVQAAEHENLARVHHKKSQRQLRRAVQKLKSADRTLLDADGRRRIDSLELIVKSQQQAIAHLEVRTERQEQALDIVRQQAAKAENLADRVARMEEMLGRLQPTAFDAGG